MAPEPALGGSVHESSRLSRSLSRKQLGRIDSGAPFHSDSIAVGTEISKQASGGALLQDLDAGYSVPLTVHHAYIVLPAFKRGQCMLQ